LRPLDRLRLIIFRPFLVDMRLRNPWSRLAKPGEFSERAFLNDKLDLAQAEAIADLIDSSSVEAARSAIRSLEGEFSKKIHQLRDAITHLRVYIEAAIDFPEEEIDFLADSRIQNQLDDIKRTLNEIMKSAQQGALLRDGISLVIVGEPNVGKSTLLNALSGRETAIVTEIPGTTRDILRERILLDGIPLHIIDTAGLRDTDDVVEREGIKRAWLEAQNADHLLLLYDAEQSIVLQEKIDSINSQLENPIPITIVCNKIDLMPQLAKEKHSTDYPIMYISAKTHQGLDKLKQHIKEAIGYQASEENQFIARRRHLDALQKTHHAVTQADSQLQQNKAGELVAEELRQAQMALAEITGEFSSDDLLGEIFSSFCIGK